MSSSTTSSDEDSSNRSCSDNALYNIKLRPYQRTLFEKAINRNIIVVLPTGTGKTMIAINLILNKLHQTEGEFPQTAKRSVFLAPTRDLVDQQAKVIKQFVNANIERLHGDHGVDYKTAEDWNEHWRKNQVLVFTPQTFVDILIKGYIRMQNINLIIIDEAHHALKKSNKPSKHPYHRLMDIYRKQTKDESEEEKPRLLGLTASLFNSQIDFDKIENTIKEFEEVYDAKVESDDTRQFIKEAQVFVEISDNSVFMNSLMMHKNNVQSVVQHDEPLKKTIEMLEALSKDSTMAASLKKALEKVTKLCYEQMGPWFAVEALKLYKSSLSSLSIGTTMTNVFTCLQAHIEAHFRPHKMTDLAFAQFGPRSGKIRSLLKLLTFFPNSLNCIVFVNERTDANLIYRWLLLLSENIPEFRFIKPGFICGSRAKGFIRFDKNTTDFKAKFECNQLNVMIATSVLEEGIDVPACNIVIRYDFPVNFRAFTQSKGRARDKNSFCFLLVDGKNEVTTNWEHLLNNYKQTEQFLKGISTSGQSADSDFEDPPVELEDLYATFDSFKTPAGAELHEEDSLRILHQYLQRLPSDFFTECRPNFNLLQKQSMFCYIFILPINSSLTGIVKGEYRPNKTSAKLSCAFKVCKLLFEKGELDDHLNIISKEFLLSKHFEELNLKIIHHRAKSKGQLKCLPEAITYSRLTSAYSQSLRNSPTDPSNQFHLYMIEFPSSYSVFGKNLDSSLRIGLLTSYQLPCSKIESLIYLNSNQLRVRIELNQSYTFPPADVRLCAVKYFHHHVLEHVLINHRRTKDDSSEKQSTLLDELPKQMTNFFLVPIKHKQNQNLINFDLIQELKSWQMAMNEFHLQRKKVKLSEQTAEQLAITYPEKTVFGCFHKAKLVLYAVKDISNVVPTDTFQWNRKRVDAEGDQEPKKKKETVETSYIEYYKEMYNYTLEYTKMPMLHASLVEPILRSNWKFGITYKVAKVDKSKTTAEEEKKQKEEEGDSGIDVTEVVAIEKQPHQLFPVELSLKYPLPLSYCLMLNSFPVILYRLESFIIAAEYLKELAAKESPEVGYTIRDDKKLPYSLLTADSFQNQSSNQIMREMMEEEDVPRETGSRDDYKLLNIDSIEEKKDTTQMAVTTSTDQQIIQNVQNILSIQPEENFEQKDESNLDDLLAKLRVTIPKAKLQQRLPWREIQAANESLEYGGTSLYIFTGNIDEHIDVSFNTFDYVAYPNPWYIVKAFTLKKANDIYNLEQLETVGDAFLKMTTALFLYFNYMSYDEGKLTQLKTALICNENLYRLALEGDLQKYLIAKPLQIGENWVVPFYNPASGQRLIDDAKFTKEQELNHKNIADAVESLIGAFLVYGSAGSALCFFRSIGLKVFDPTAFKEVEDINPVRYYQREFEKNFENIELEEDDEEDRAMIDSFNVNLEMMVEDAYRFGFLNKVEEVIGYSFKHKYFLVQAFTHPSFTRIEHTAQMNYISSYQRLEFIGDAILDYLITFVIYQKNQKLRPGDITLLRTSLVNNIFYASIAVKYNLHSYLRYSSQTLQTSIANFVQKYKYLKFEQLGALINFSFGEQEAGRIDDVDVPKALADIFESLVGAIYIDNGFDLDAVWRIVYRMIKVEFDYFSEHIPMNPLAWLEKHYVNRFNFSPQTVVNEKMRHIELTVTDASGNIEKYSGYGITKKMCKTSAARCFMDAHKGARQMPGFAINEQSTSSSNDDSEIQFDPHFAVTQM